MAVWNTEALLLRQVLHAIQGGNWQRGGGKGPKPKPVDLPDSKGAASRATPKASGEDIARRLQSMGQIPADVKI